MIAKSIFKLFLRKKETTMSTTHSRETHTPLRLASTAQTLPTSATLAMNEAVAKRRAAGRETIHLGFGEASFPLHPLLQAADRKSTRLNSSHTVISYAVFCLKKKKKACNTFRKRTNIRR